MALAEVPKRFSAKTDGHRNGIWLDAFAKSGYNSDAPPLRLQQDPFAVTNTKSLSSLRIQLGERDPCLPFKTCGQAVQVG